MFLTERNYTFVPLQIVWIRFGYVYSALSTH